MGIPPGFIRSVPRLRRLIRFYGLHRSHNDPVRLNKLVKGLRIKVKQVPFEERHLHGISLTESKFKRNKIILLKRGDSFYQQRKALAHELYHILEHPGGIKYFSNAKFQFKVEEREADYGGAFLYLAPQQVEPFILNDATSLELALSFGITKDFVEKRAEIYLFLKEYQDLNPRIERLFNLKSYF